MLAAYYNNVDAMPKDTLGNGLVGLSGGVTAAFNLAMTGSKWASFGENGAWGTGYYWGANQTGPGTSTFDASLGLINNYAAPPLNADVSQSPPSSFLTDYISLSGINNVFTINGSTQLILSSTHPAAAGGESIYPIFSSDPANIDAFPVPEPTSVLVMGGLFGIGAVGLVACRRKRNA